jgi:hypothetical protein
MPLLPRTALSLLLLLSAAVPSLFAYSRQGHEAIALLAYENPALSPTAKAAITAILAGESIADAAEWPDAIKPPFGAISRTQEARAFIAAHPSSHVWHFCNFPLGSTSYDPAAKVYAADMDIVHAIRGCIAVLEGMGNFDGLSKHDALRYLVHLVGDVHQPLHTITGYFDVHDPEHVVLLGPRPTMPKGTFKDGGGNDLFLTAKTELHALWDDDLVEKLVGSKDATALVGTLAPKVSATGYLTKGNYHDWAATWASDSMAVAIEAYQGISFGSFTAATDAQNRTHHKIAITLPANYKNREEAAERQQIVKAASHLLQLFNAMHWR